MALFKSSDIATVKQYLPIKGNFDMNLLLSVINDAEREHIIPALGDTLYTSLEANYQSNSLTPDEQALLPYAHGALAPFLLLYIKDILNVNISNTGFTITVTDEQKPAFEWQVARLERTIARLAFDRVEQLFDFLEKNKATYTSWANSSAYTEFKETFIHTARDFTHIFSRMRGSRQLFVLFKPIMLRVEEEYIEPILGSTLYDTLKQEDKDNTLSADNQKLIPYIQRAVAFQTVLQAIDEMALEITPNALILPYYSERENINASQPADNTQREVMQRYCQRRSEQYRGGLKAYLDMNYTLYPDYPYDDSGESQDLDNTDLKIFMLD